MSCVSRAAATTTRDEILPLTPLYTPRSSIPKPPCFNIMESSSTLNSTATNALTLNWSFGFNEDVVDGVHSLCSDGRQALFYVSAHTGVIYDYTKRTQELLQVWQPKSRVSILPCSNTYVVPSLLPREPQPRNHPSSSHTTKNDVGIPQSVECAIVDCHEHYTKEPICLVEALEYLLRHVFLWAIATACRGIFSKPVRHAARL